MPNLSVTTRCLRRGVSFEAAARNLLDLGFERLVLDPELRQSDWEVLASFLPRRAVRAAFLFAPFPGLPIPGAPSPPRLGSLDRDEGREVRKQARRSVQFADRYEVPTIVVPPAALEEPDLDDVLRTLRSRDSGPDERERLRRRRAGSDSSRRQLDALLGDLSGLLEVADDYEVEVALVAAGFPSEIPDYGELELIAREFAGAPLVVWGDALRYERSLVAGVEGAAEFARGSPAASAVLLHDGDAVRSHRPLGSGQVDLDRWKELPRDEIEWVLDLAESTPPDALLAARAILEEKDRGSIGPPGPPPFLDTSSRDLV